MNRVRIALIAAPVIVSVLFGVFGLIVLPITLLFTGVVALPLFYVFKRRGWLRWWHAFLVGLLCGAIFAVLDTLATSPSHADFFGLADALYFCGVGSLIALLFWWLGLFRNSAFPSVPSSIPWSMLVVIPLALGGFWLHRWFNSTFYQGRVIAVRGKAPTRETTVRLSTGSIVVTRFDDDDRASSTLMNQCWHRGSTYISRRSGW